MLQPIGDESSHDYHYWPPQGLPAVTEQAAPIARVQIFFKRLDDGLAKIVSATPNTPQTPQNGDNFANSVSAKLH